MSDLIPYTNGMGGENVPFFKKPGSVTGTIVLALGGLFALFHINPILSFLNSLLTNTITFVGLCIALAAIAYCIVDPKVRTIISELYFMLIRKVMGIVVDMDPISIVRHHIEKMKDKITEIQRNIGSLNGLIKETERRIAAKKKELEDNAIRAKKCEESNKHQEAQVYYNQVVRLTDILKRQEARYADAKKWYKILSDLKYSAQLTVQDTENEVNERVEEWEMIKKQHKVFASVMSILNGSDEFKTFNMAMDKMSFDITQKLGEMENIINETSGIMTQLNLDNAVTSERASALLERYDKYGIDGLLSNKSQLALEDKSTEFKKSSQHQFTTDEPEKVNAIPMGTRHNDKTLGADNKWFN